MMTTLSIFILLNSIILNTFIILIKITHEYIIEIICIPRSIMFTPIPYTAIPFIK